jgi:hypothetical protein
MGIEEQAEKGVLKAVESEGFISKITGKITEVFKTNSQELVTAREELTRVKGELATAQAEAKKAKEDLATAKAEHATAIAAKDVEITNAKGSAGKIAAELAAGQGMPAKDLPAAGNGTNPSADAKNKYQALLKSDPRAAGEFYAKNKELLWS